MIRTTRCFRRCVLGVFLLSILPVGGMVFAQDTNTAFGTGALQQNKGALNSAFGYEALGVNTTGEGNTATGYRALYSNSYDPFLPSLTGNGNTADGERALEANTVGRDNTAVGAAALNGNTTGRDNTAIGAGALASNLGEENTASGSGALSLNSAGIDNTATGSYALSRNNTGYNNTAVGAYALWDNETGYGNAASGLEALRNNIDGYRNTAVGTVALYSETTGHYNIGVGWGAGQNVTSGSDNIEIGTFGVPGDDNTIRVGTEGTQKAAYVAGISGVAVTGADVVVSSTGQLGIVGSSVRYKADIQPVDKRSQELWQLRPVTFRYKQDPQGHRQYGLIAEEVAKVYPELVVHSEGGDIESVQYRQLIPLMLNEMQHQQAALNELKAQNQMLRTALTQQDRALESRLERLERTKAIRSR